MRLPLRFLHLAMRTPLSALRDAAIVDPNKSCVLHIPDARNLGDVKICETVCLTARQLAECVHATARAVRALLLSKEDMPAEWLLGVSVSV